MDVSASRFLTTSRHFAIRRDFAPTTLFLHLTHRICPPSSFASFAIRPCSQLYDIIREKCLHIYTHINSQRAARTFIRHTCPFIHRLCPRDRPMHVRDHNSSTCPIEDSTSAQHQYRQAPTRTRLPRRRSSNRDAKSSPMRFYKELAVMRGKSEEEACSCAKSPRTETINGGMRERIRYVLNAPHASLNHQLTIAY